MAVVVVNRRRVVLGVFRRESPGIERGGSAALGGQRTERRVLVVRGESAVGGDDFAHVLVAVVGVEERCLVQGAWCLVLPDEGTSRDGFGRVPDDDRGEG